MREQGTGWDPKGPASVHKARMAFDAAGNITAYEFTSKGFSRVDVDTNGGKPEDTLAGHTRGVALHSGDGFGVPAESYEFANKRLAWETVPPLLDRRLAAALIALAAIRSARKDPLRERILHGRGGGGAQSRSIEFRLRHLKDARDIAVHQRQPTSSAGSRARRRSARRREGQRRRHRLCAAQRHARGRDRRGGDRSLVRQDLCPALVVRHDCGQIITRTALPNA